MPGLFGFIRKKGGEKQAGEKLLAGMQSKLTHNPAYRSETYSSDWFGLGVIDIPTPGQSFLKHHPESRITAASGGYIYDWQNLPGDTVLAASDNPGRLAELYRRLGEGVIGKPNGSHNTAIFDETKKEALIFNDRLGHRHLFYYEDDEIFLFAGEYKAFLAYDKFMPQLEDAAVADYFNYFFTLGDKTLLKGVRRLRWAHKITFRDGRVSLGPYWEFHFEPDSSHTIPELIEEGQALWQDNLRLQLAHADRILIPLSGGMDSRMVLGEASLMGKEIFTFSHGIKGCLDETIGRRVAAAAGVKNHSLIEFDPNWLVDDVEKLIWLAGPLAPTVPGLLLGVCRNYGLPPETTALLNGLAGRTAFVYSYFNKLDITADLDMAEKLQRLKRPLFGQFVNDVYYESFRPEWRLNFGKRYFPAIEEELTRHLKASPLFCHQRDLFMLENRFRGHFDDVDLNRYFYHDHMACEDERTLDFYLKVPTTIKVYPDRALLREGLKIKFPHLAAIPTQAGSASLFEAADPRKKRRREQMRRLKLLLERLSGGHLRLYNMDNYIHYSQWYRKHRRIRKYFEETLLDKRTCDRGYFNRARVEDLLKSQKRGVYVYNDLALLLAFEIFNRLYIDRR